jgi:hypothetical protein
MSQDPDLAATFGRVAAHLVAPALGAIFTD